MTIKTYALSIASLIIVAGCATPSELRIRHVTFAASSTTQNAQQTLNCVAKAWEQATNQPVVVSGYDKGYTAVAQSKTLFGTNTDFVIDSGNARTGGAIFKMWSSMKRDATDQLIDIIQPCL